MGIVAGGAEIALERPERQARTAFGVAGGFAGGFALGATAGLFCGPGAPVCSIVAGLVLGIAGSVAGRLAAETIYDEVTNPRAPSRAMGSRSVCDVRLGNTPEA